LAKLFNILLCFLVNHNGKLKSHNYDNILWWSITNPKLCEMNIQLWANWPQVLILVLQDIQHQIQEAHKANKNHLKTLNIFPLPQKIVKGFKISMPNFFDGTRSKFWSFIQHFMSSSTCNTIDTPIMFFTMDWLGYYF
jgi:hypothetical protein